ncbi:MAG TPA: lipid-A-disaccharide synthase [Candidatus Cloacimonas sp.]|nr:lipid-A-disaccharide synthase [Candidatus Cloacimonas sp.]
MIRKNSYKIFWLAGESSADLHSELVMKALNDKFGNLTHIGIGGPRMQRQGLKPIFPFDKFAVMGFVEVVKHLIFFFKVQIRLSKLFSTEKFDLAILVDYPGLNLRIAKMADEMRIPVLYFICPQFWAWKHNRVYQLRDSVRYVACILPFEEELLKIHNINCSYIGHPIAEEINFELDRDSFARFFGLDSSKKWIGFFPGSRNNEITKMLPVFLQAAKKWNQNEYQILFSKSHNVNHQLYMHLIEGQKDINIIDGYNYEMMKYCELLVCTSGTVTLEAAYIGTPLVICYKASYLSYLIGRKFVRIKRIGLPNIVLDSDLLPELIQGEMNPANIYKAGMQILTDSEMNTKIRKELFKLRAMLSNKHPSIEMPKIVRHLFETYG